MSQLNCKCQVKLQLKLDKPCDAKQNNSGQPKIRPKSLYYEIGSKKGLFQGQVHYTYGSMFHICAGQAIWHSYLKHQQQWHHQSFDPQSQEYLISLIS